MLQEEYKRLLQLIEESFENGKVSLASLLKEAITFFEKLRYAFPSASLEEKNELSKIMAHLHEKLKDASKRIAEQAGLSEEELKNFMENPSNFTPEQWQTIQTSKQELYRSARRFSEALEQKQDFVQTPEGEESSQKTPSSKPSSHRKPRRKDWTKS